MILPALYYSLLQDVFSAMDMPADYQEKEVEEFEKTLMADFAKALLVKLPESERQPIEQLAGRMTQDIAAKAQLEEKVAEWVNQQEMRDLFEKVAEKSFDEMVQFLYKHANGQKRAKLESLVDITVLKN